MGSYVDVHVQANGSSRQRAAERDPNAAVIVVFADDLRGRVIGIEDQTVVHGDSGNLSHDCQRSCGAVLEHTGRQINVAGRSTSLQRSQQHSALQDKIFGVFGSRKSIEETLQGVKLNEFVSWSCRSSCTTLQVEIAPAGHCILGRTRHSTISSALRTARSAPCRDLATSSSAAGLAPLRLSQRRSASQATSPPSRCRSRMTSMRERSGEYTGRS